jgi:predicted flap endonuclease-1-like 5' DNA nuclease
MPGIDLDDLDLDPPHLPDLSDLTGRRGERGAGGRMLALVVLAVLAVTAFVAYRVVTILLEGRRGERDAQRDLVGVAANEARTGTAAVAAIDGGDDLKVIEGIGPRFESVLKAAGVRTYQDLAEMRPGRIETILREAGGRMADPTTWPAQARLASEGNWQELSEMQAMLKGGRQPN